MEFAMDPLEALCARVGALEATVGAQAAALQEAQAHVSRVDASLQKALENLFPRVEELLRGLQAKAQTSAHARPLVTTRASAPPMEAVDAASRTWREVNGERQRDKERERPQRRRLAQRAHRDGSARGPPAPGGARRAGGVRAHAAALRGRPQRQGPQGADPALPRLQVRAR